ncbi:MAG: MATE family efflux transporter [Anaerolineae bacterium]|nr:MATE family efflux transporter [Anaerolineae bacterium]
MKVKSPDQHPFHTRPNRTLIVLSIPALFSLIAEPITGLVDTAFVARLGSTELAALGIGTIALTSLFWVFNFLGIGTQTEVAQALGQNKGERAVAITSLSLVLAGGFGLLLIALIVPFAAQLAILMGADGSLADTAATYIRLRAFGSPAVLMMLVGFGAMRGRQDMRTPLYIAVAVNVINIVLDMMFIFGFGPIPAMGVAGSAVASTLAQYVGAAWAVLIVLRYLGFSRDFKWSDATDLLTVGRDLFMRTGLLMTFLLFATRVATQIGPDSGAAHQAIRQVWLFSALVMEAFAMTAQSLVGYFKGSLDIASARRVSLYSMWWSLATGIVLTIGMLAFTPQVIALLVPETAVAVFTSAWVIASLAQPVNALAFLTDGVHWGTSDYRYLRNAMLIATTTGIVGLLLVDTSKPDALLWVWLVTSIWIGIRGVFGMIRIWPGMGRSPLELPSASAV